MAGVRSSLSIYIYIYYMYYSILHIHTIIYNHNQSYTYILYSINDQAVGSHLTSKDRSARPSISGRNMSPHLEMFNCHVSLPEGFLNSAQSS